MRILVISNVYPPYYIGGYELGCRDVVEKLKSRGHEVQVLTSTYGVDFPVVNEGVFRLLKSQIGWGEVHFARYIFKVLLKELNNQRVARRLYKELQPDVVYLWNLASISFSCVFTAEKCGLPTCYLVSDEWLSRWESDSWFVYCCKNLSSQSLLKRLIQSALRLTSKVLGILPDATSPDLKNVEFTSQYLKQMALRAGKSVQSAKVRYWGIDIAQYQYRSNSSAPCRLLYVGQVIPHKGVHTAIQALKIIIQSDGLPPAKLTIAGGSMQPDYESYLRELVIELGLGEYVHFTGMLTRDEVISIYQQHDILIFPSIWDEPFSITVLEAMASGLAVVGTPTGGSGEIFEDGINALIFPKEDAELCAKQTSRLLQDSEFYERVRRAGRKTIEEKFQLDQMVSYIEQDLTMAIRTSRKVQ